MSFGTCTLPDDFDLEEYLLEAAPGDDQVTAAVEDRMVADIQRAMFPPRISAAEIGVDSIDARRLAVGLAPLTSGYVYVKEPLCARPATDYASPEATADLQKQVDAMIEAATDRALTHEKRYGGLLYTGGVFSKADLAGYSCQQDKQLQHASGEPIRSPVVEAWDGTKTVRFTAEEWDAAGGRLPVARIQTETCYGVANPDAKPMTLRRTGIPSAPEMRARPRQLLASHDNPDGWRLRDLIDQVVQEVQAHVPPPSPARTQHEAVLSRLRMLNAGVIDRFQLGRAG